NRAAHKIVAVDDRSKELHALGFQCGSRNTAGVLVCFGILPALSKGDEFTVAGRLATLLHDFQIFELVRQEFGQCDCGKAGMFLRKVWLLQEIAQKLFACRTGIRNGLEAELRQLVALCVMSSDDLPGSLIGGEDLAIIVANIAGAIENPFATSKRGF